MNKIFRLIALAAVVGTAVLSYSLPQSAKASSNFVPASYPLPGSGK